jgi:hypothetical protein
LLNYLLHSQTPCHPHISSLCTILCTRYHATLPPSTSFRFRNKCAHLGNFSLSTRQVHIPAAFAYTILRGSPVALGESPSPAAFPKPAPSRDVLSQNLIAPPLARPSIADSSILRLVRPRVAGSIEPATPYPSVANSRDPATRNPRGQLYRTRQTSAVGAAEASPTRKRWEPKPKETRAP